MIVVYGATGLAGELITHELVRRGANVAIAGRDRRRLKAVAATLDSPVDVRVAEVGDQASLQRAFDGAQVVVACAGPFSRLGPRVLSAAITSSCHYVDISSEQDFLRGAYERFEAAAHRAGVVCVSGLAFRGALGDWAAALAHQSLADRDLDVEAIDVAYAIRKEQLTSRERTTAALALTTPTLIWRHDRWETLAPGAARKRFAFGDRFGDGEAVLFGGGEVVSIPRHLEVGEVRTFLWLETKNPLLWEATRLAPYLSPLLGPLARGALGRFLLAQAEASTDPADARVRADTEFAIVATARSGFDESRVLLSGRDPYQLTAEICSAGALALASRGHSEGGLLTPAQVFDPRARLFSLAARELIAVEQS